MREFLVKTSGGTDNGWGPGGLKYDLLPARFEKHPTPDNRGRDFHRAFQGAFPCPTPRTPWNHTTLKEGDVFRGPTGAEYVVRRARSFAKPWAVVIERTEVKLTKRGRKDAKKARRLAKEGEE